MISIRKIMLMLAIVLAAAMTAVTPAYAETGTNGTCSWTWELDDQSVFTIYPTDGVSGVWEPLPSGYAFMMDGSKIVIQPGVSVTTAADLFNINGNAVNKHGVGEVDLSGLDTTGVTDFTRMFAHANGSYAPLDLTPLDMTSIETGTDMFYGLTAKTLVLGPKTVLLPDMGLQGNWSKDGGATIISAEELMSTYDPATMAGTYTRIFGDDEYEQTRLPIWKTSFDVDAFIANNYMYDRSFYSQDGSFETTLERNLLQQSNGSGDVIDAYCINHYKAWPTHGFYKKVEATDELIDEILSRNYEGHEAFDRNYRAFGDTKTEALAAVSYYLPKIGYFDSDNPDHLCWTGGSGLSFNVGNLVNAIVGDSMRSNFARYLNGIPEWSYDQGLSDDDWLINPDGSATRMTYVWEMSDHPEVFKLSEDPVFKKFSDIPNNEFLKLYLYVPEDRDTQAFLTGNIDYKLPVSVSKTVTGNPSATDLEATPFTFSFTPADPLPGDDDHAKAVPAGVNIDDVTITAADFEDNTASVDAMLPDPSVFGEEGIYSFIISENATDSPRWEDDQSEFRLRLYVVKAQISPVVNTSLTYQSVTIERVKNPDGSAYDSQGQKETSIAFSNAFTPKYEPVPAGVELPGDKTASLALIVILMASMPIAGVIRKRERVC